VIGLSFFLQKSIKELLVESSSRSSFFFLSVTFLANPEQ
jgi:hypothetical protein